MLVCYACVRVQVHACLCVRGVMLSDTNAFLELQMNMNFGLYLGAAEAHGAVLTASEVEGRMWLCVNRYLHFPDPTAPDDREYVNLSNRGTLPPTSHSIESERWGGGREQMWHTVNANCGKRLGCLLTIFNPI